MISKEQTEALSALGLTFTHYSQAAPVQDPKVIDAAAVSRHQQYNTIVTLVYPDRPTDPIVISDPNPLFGVAIDNAIAKARNRGIKGTTQQTITSLADENEKMRRQIEELKAAASQPAKK